MKLLQKIKEKLQQPIEWDDRFLKMFLQLSISATAVIILLSIVDIICNIIRSVVS